MNSGVADEENESELTGNHLFQVVSHSKTFTAVAVLQLLDEDRIRLDDAGAALILGSDAPVAPLDPWITSAAAVHRTKDADPRWHPEQELPLALALAASTRGRTHLADSAVADLVVLDSDPFQADRAQLRQISVAATMLGGR